MTSPAWVTVGWVLPDEDMTPYLCDIAHLYRILVPSSPSSFDGASIHHLPLGRARVRGVLVRQPASLPKAQANVRDRPCSTEWAEQRKWRRW